MMIFAFLTSFIIGWLTIEALLKNNNPLSPALQLPLAFILGLGFSSLLTFLSFLMGNGFHVKLICGLNLLALVILLLINTPHRQRHRKKESLYNTESQHYSGLSKKYFGIPSKITKTDLAGILFWMILFFAIYALSCRHPFGEWDAWALWNVKSKFLIFAKDHWRSIFTELHGHTQPDYPLLLPFIHAWLYCFTQTELLPIPRITAVTLATLCPMLVYGGLRQLTTKGVALLATAILIFHPFYIFLSTAQYADILLSIYLLASIITLICALRYHHESLAFLCGLFLGLMSFVKNEGIVLMFLLASLGSLFIIFKNKCRPTTLNRALPRAPFPQITKTSAQTFKFFIAGTLITASATLFFKLFLAPPNKDILINPINTHLTFFNLQGLLLIKEALWHEFFHKRWCLIWFFLSFLLITGIPKFFKKECAIISLFFICYFLVILYVYLTTINFDLSWRLKSTLHRILFYLLPSSLFFGFYVHWRKDDIQTPAPH